MSQLHVAVVGATSLVGQAILELLAERQFPVARVFAVDDAAHEAETAGFGNIELDVHDQDGFDFAQVGLALFAAGSETARRLVPEARAAGAHVIDFSAAFRADASVPLLAPGVNDRQVLAIDGNALVSVPNCTVTPLAQALAALVPLGIGRVTVSTYQSVSGSGRDALEELANQTTALFAQRDAEPAVYAKRIAFNVLPRIGAADAGGDSDEERSVMAELRRLLGQPALDVEATCVRVPVFFGHAWSVAVELEGEVDVARVRHLFAASGLHVVDAPAEADGYATPMEVAGNDQVWISRVRKTRRGLAFWVAADNIRAGAAMPVVRIAEALLSAGKLS